MFVRDLTDDEAPIDMVDSNIQREELLPSETAFALRMKMEEFIYVIALQKSNLWKFRFQTPIYRVCYGLHGKEYY